MKLQQLHDSCYSEHNIKTLYRVWTSSERLGSGKGKGTTARETLRQKTEAH